MDEKPTARSAQTRFETHGGEVMEKEKSTENEAPVEYFFKKNDCPKCGATAKEYITCSVDRNGYTTSCNMCPKGSIDV
jgi:hypothetical protein